MRTRWWYGILFTRRLENGIGLNPRRFFIRCKGRAIMSAHDRRLLPEGITSQVSRLTIVLVALAPIAILIGMPTGLSWGAQTREQCHNCCKQRGYDDYYMEQCRLKCFRTPDHCASSKTEAAEPAEPRPSERKPAQVEKPEKRPPKRTVTLAFPSPLNLVAGKESEAAAQILALNGISPGHPSYQVALNNVTNVLVQFVRTHPQGGQLPTTELERIVLQYK